jgi:pentatricopeptide repeat protein
MFFQATELGDVEALLKMERQALRYGLTPDFDFFNMLIEGAVVHEPAIVSNIIGSMKQYGFKPNADTFAGIIKGFAATDRFARAIASFRLMLDSGIEPTAQIYSTVISVLTKMGHVSRAAELFQEMKEKFPMGREQYTVGSFSDCRQRDTTD